jgi:cytosine/adenosine deaminase-related metal-dependent hydrolase
MAETSLLLRSGTVITLSKDDKVVPLRDTDLLIEGTKIAKIGSKLTAPSGAKVIDCKGKIVSPGFIDTHHHVWQSQLKGRHSNELLIDYMVTGRCFLGPRLRCVKS